MSNKIQIFYSCDDNFVKYTIVSLKSLIENADKNRNYHVHILHTNISEKMKEMVFDLENSNFQITFDDVTSHLQILSNDLPIRDYYTKTTYYRLFIPEMYKEYDKAIYIDSDTVVLGDISQLYDTNIDDYYVGACHEQAMVQVDEYGKYCEEVCGVSRNEFFNAGILLINCNAFRKNNLLSKFTKLLDEYNFVVTQDEDYLNILCKNKVYWLENGWNTEVFGNIPCKEEDIKIIHYIMVSKPWHYHDCRFKEYFWEYANKTLVKQEILDELNAYTDKEREQDLISCENLLALAVKETNREDAYYKKIKKKMA